MLRQRLQDIRRVLKLAKQFTEVVTVLGHDQTIGTRRLFTAYLNNPRESPYPRAFVTCIQTLFYLYTFYTNTHRICVYVYTIRTIDFCDKRFTEINFTSVNFKKNPTCIRRVATKQRCDYELENSLVTSTKMRLSFAQRGHRQDADSHVTGYAGRVSIKLHKNRERQRTGYCVWRAT